MTTNRIEMDLMDLDDRDLFTVLQEVLEDRAEELMITAQELGEGSLDNTLTRRAESLMKMVSLARHHRRIAGK